MLVKYNPHTAVKISTPSHGTTVSAGQRRGKSMVPMGQGVARRHNNMNPEFQQIRKQDANIFSNFDNMANKMIKHVEGIFNLFTNFGGIQHDLNIFNGYADFGPFSNNHHTASRGSGTIKVLQRTYVTETKIDHNGRKVTEKYMSNNFSMRGHDGNTITESHQAYHNPHHGVQKMAQERKFNDVGRKVVHEKNVNTGDVRETHLFHKMGHDQITEFDDRWDQYDESHGFFNAFGRSLGYDNRVEPQHRPEPQQRATKSRPQPENHKQSSRPVNGTPQIHVRRRQNDIQPTTPGRIVLSIANEPQARPQQRHHEPEPAREVVNENQQDFVRNVAPRVLTPALRPRIAAVNNNTPTAPNVPDRNGNFAIRNANTIGLPSAG
jgi:hypothetical protein